MTLRLFLAVLMAVVLASGPGCRPKAPAGSPPASVSADSAARTVAAVDPIDQPALRKLLKERNGKILFLNVWATWCAPCVEEYPDLVKLAHTYADSDVEIVGISADYPDEVEAKILPFLRKQKASFRNFVAKFDHQEDFINSVNPSWSGALPATIIIDPEGSQRFFRVGAGTFELFKSSIDSVRMKRKGLS